MTDQKIRLGIVGLSAKRGWAALTHIPALAKLPQFEIRGLSASSPESAKAAAEKFGVPFGTDDVAELVGRPDIDLVVVSVKVIDHKAAVDAALNAGKHVLCEWPLGKDLGEAEAMAALAHAKGVRGFVNLQARFHPAVMYVRDLLGENYVGKVLSSTVLASAGGPGRTSWPQAMAFYLDRRNGGGMMNITFGHTVDGVCAVLGELQAVKSELAIRRTTTTITETGESAAITTPDVISLTGQFDNEALASLSFLRESYGTGFHWEIDGDQGAILVTAAHGNMQLTTLKVFGANGDNRQFVELPIPDRYAFKGVPMNESSSAVGHLYEALAKDLATGSSTAPSFDHGVVRHRLIAEMERSAFRSD